MNSSALAIEDGTLYPSPDAPPVRHATVIVRDGRIVKAGPAVSIPSDVKVISGEGGSILAGFWNSHVHFTEPKWNLAATDPADRLNFHLRDMLTSRGFTSVVDTGSNPVVTLGLRARLESNELIGPSILTAGPSVFPPNGIPYYLRDDLSPELLPFVPQPSTPNEAVEFVRRNLSAGADLVKLFTGSYVTRGQIVTMPESVARAAVVAAHAAGKLVYSHPSNLEGTRIAIRSGVDVLAHPPDATEGVDAALIGEMVARGMSMTPTLKMFADTVSTDSDYIGPITDLVRSFAERGGDLLFGTDVGYMTDYTTEAEFLWLQRAGLNASRILRMLTTAPAIRFGVEGSLGTVTPGARADIVLVAGDPIEDLRSFARVLASFRAGRTLFQRY